ncbi:response regulator [Cohnella sp. WQ 127256]|uniref:response regulator n=1 Tax=Cohnella sp. WQ 127256 TaxID=2938790 RepID=UPI0021180A46|nr:response regulator [Cohnella sp. WQ 127256]
MLTMMVVDDEMYALKGITQGIDWSDLPISTILEAENVAQAKKQLLEQQVDLVISDIEMPGANGIELLRQIRELTPNTLVVFLTGHARFEYAQEALHYGCFDYVLKPVDHDVLKDIIRRAVEEIERRKEQQNFENTLEEYRLQWTNQLPILVERFWQDVLIRKIPTSANRLSRELELYNIPLEKDGRALPVLLSIERWEVELDARDESIMEYALRKAATEIILGENSGTILQDRNDLNLVLLYGDSMDRKVLKARCVQYVKACNDYFHCRVSCYMGEAVGIGELSEALERLTQMERANVSQPQTVIDSTQNFEASPGTNGPTLPAFTEWTIMLDSGNIEELVKSIEDTLMRFEEESSSRETLELFYFGFVHLLFQAANRKGISMYDMVSAQEVQDGQHARTPALMQGWATKLLLKVGQTFVDRQRDASAVISKIQLYIQDNLHKELSRDDIANSVYRNPAYLSRLFRKETGLSLSDYIVQVKIEKVKVQLKETNDKISNIAEGLGYLHFSYFAKLFKKVTGVTPQEYRKKHQTML